MRKCVSRSLKTLPGMVRTLCSTAFAQNGDTYTYTPEKKAPRTALLLEEHGEEILGVYALPEAHRKRMRTTNMLERQNQELKRRTRVVRIFPNPASCLRLVSALLIETSQQWMERIYLSMEEQAEDQPAAQAA